MSKKTTRKSKLFVRLLCSALCLLALGCAALFVLKKDSKIAAAISIEEDDEVETYRIVTTIRSNSLKNLISKESPLGEAIFGHKVGDRCEVKVNDNYSYYVEIRKIINTGDDGSDQLRKF